MTLWYIGNTSVRSAFRLRDGLVALSTSYLQGNMRGQDGDRAFRELLGQHGIVSLGTDETNSVGRKWRSALGKLGFLYPEIPRSSTIRQEDVGAMDTITPNGWRLIRSETVPAMQECFLRSLAAQFMPIQNEDRQTTWFSPLRHTLAVLLELERQTGEAYVSFIEMALIVQATSSADNIATVVANIITLRNERNAAASKRRFDSVKYEEAGNTFGLMPATFRDYADANLRYLKATGLVQNRGRGIALVPEKRLFAELMARDISAPASELERYTTLCNGAQLPTDTQDAALNVLHDLIAQLSRMGIPFILGDRPVNTPADIAIIRHEIEDIIFKQKEEIYAREQADQWEEIATYIDLIASRRDRRRIDEENEIVIPRSETPAYLEWILWRAFLAIDSLENKPYEARRFKVDQDFLPVGTAPGNGPDLIMEFRDFVIVIEVTLTESSRQEAAEGEPVRRHVADLMNHYTEANGKPVYGLFIANNIDSNTAETFRIGVWYSRSDERMHLQIIPITISQFNSFFKALFTTNNATPEAVINLMNDCEQYRAGCEAPEWKNMISQTIERTVSGMVAQ
ncbi:restriction endonuclease [Dehalobacter sp. MCB1]|uniref:AlwI family type II restriction endonuclease n=1 Tax=unclassified Dehalobacter TaxID=2635733 RepID=UPI000E6D2839|nr:MULTISPECIES: AlwI family type II restriction endonuclease [unclassified Dehalobacter]RJE47913.1 restriction endonuclease [Dehalobacter sp. MCB1]TCX56091.1 AlwI family type II restriction endonuclease [Dehalobacter sp. 12DCB1]